MLPFHTVMCRHLSSQVRNSLEPEWNETLEFDQLVMRKLL